MSNDPKRPEKANNSQFTSILSSKTNKSLRETALEQLGLDSNSLKSLKEQAAEKEAVVAAYHNRVEEVRALEAKERCLVTASTAAAIFEELPGLLLTSRKQVKVGVKGRIFRKTEKQLRSVKIIMVSFLQELAGHPISNANLILLDDHGDIYESFFYIKNNPDISKEYLEKGFYPMTDNLNFVDVFNNGPYAQFNLALRAEELALKATVKSCLWENIGATLEEGLKVARTRLEEKVRGLDKDITQNGLPR